MRGKERQLQSLETKKRTNNDRRDILSIKHDLLELVANEEYWPTFRDFVSGRCPRAIFDCVMQESLLTVQAKQLHNELIRSILQNAHFSVVPPPGVVVPTIVYPVQKFSKKCPMRPKGIDMSSLQSFTASDFGLIPGLDHFRRRIEEILKRGANVKVPNRTVGEMKKYVIRFILRLLGDCLDLIGASSLDNQCRVIRLDIVIQVVTNSGKYSGAVSDQVLSGYREI
jgi:hypothetical protein